MCQIDPSISSVKDKGEAPISCGGITVERQPMSKPTDSESISGRWAVSPIAGRRRCMLWAEPASLKA